MLGKFIEKSNKSEHHMIIDAFSYDITLHSCIEYFSELPKLLVEGKLPDLHLKLSTSSFHTFFDVINNMLKIMKPAQHVKEELFIDDEELLLSLKNEINDNQVFILRHCVVV